MESGQLAIGIVRSRPHPADPSLVSFTEPSGENAGELSGRAETLGRPRIGHDACRTSCYDVELGLSVDLLESLRIADSEGVSPFSSACREDFLSIRRRISLEKSVGTQAFSFLELTEHGMGEVRY